jgi:hypothetical protein
MSLMRMILSLMLQGVIPMFLGLGNNQWNGTAKTNEGQAQGAVGSYGSAAAGEGSALNPFFTQEMNAQHSLDPNQQNELLTNAESGAGAATGAEQGALINNATRTGNATGVTKSLDEMARDKSKAAAGASEGIAAQDVMGAKQLNQQGAAGMQGLYGTNVGAQLGAMKQANSDVATEQATQGDNWVTQLGELKKGVGEGASLVGAFAGSGD